MRLRVKLKYFAHEHVGYTLLIEFKYLVSQPAEEIFNDILKHRSGPSLDQVLWHCAAQPATARLQSKNKRMQFNSQSWNWINLMS